MTQNNDHSNSSTSHPENQHPFHQLVPDCREIIFTYHCHRILELDLPSYQKPDDFVLEQKLSTLEFALNHFSCWMAASDISYRIDFPFLKNLYSLSLCMASNVDSASFAHLKHLVELEIINCSGLRDEALQNLESLEILSLKINLHDDNMTDQAFINMKHLRELDISECSHFTDLAIENLYKAGSRLDKLDISGCTMMTDRALSFLKGIKELIIVDCPRITDAGLQHVAESVQRLSIVDCEQLSSKSIAYMNQVEMMRVSDMRFVDSEAFDCLEGTIQCLNVSYCNLNALTDSSLRFLKGISSLSLRSCSVRNLTSDAFQYLSGIKILDLSCISAGDKLSKDLLLYLSGIEELRIDNTEIRIQSEDLEPLKQVFANLSVLAVSEDFTDEKTMGELMTFIEGNGGYG